MMGRGRFGVAQQCSGTGRHIFCDAICVFGGEPKKAKPKKANPKKKKPPKPPKKKPPKPQPPKKKRPA